MYFFLRLNGTRKIRNGKEGLKNSILPVNSSAAAGKKLPPSHIDKKGAEAPTRGQEEGRNITLGVC